MKQSSAAPLPTVLFRLFRGAEADAASAWRSCALSALGFEVIAAIERLSGTVLLGGWNAELKGAYRIVPSQPGAQRSSQRRRNEKQPSMGTDDCEKRQHLSHNGTVDRDSEARETMRVQAPQRSGRGAFESALISGEGGAGSWSVQALP